MFDIIDIIAKNSKYPHITVMCYNGFMKKFLAIAVVIIIVVVFYFIFKDDSYVVPQTEEGAVSQNENGSFRPDPSNASFTFSDGVITLSGGRNEREIAPGSAFMEETVLLEKFAYGDINSDDKEDTALFLARYGAGSGTFIYLAGYISGPVTYRGTETVLIGDRISPQNISINNGVVTIEYLDRAPGEALAVEPTVPVSKQFVFKAGIFQER